MTINDSELPRVNFIFRLLGKTILAIAGWKTKINVPTEPKSIFVFAPHTSNFDFVFMMSAIYSAGIKITWLGKKDLFKGIAGPFFRWLGGVPIDRTSGISTIKGLIRVIDGSENIFVGIAPEGTRAYTEKWKIGFYYLALKTKTPISLGFLDFEKKVVGIDPGFNYDLPIEEMEEILQNYYKDVKGEHPENFGPIIIERK
jgi:1-acyl-sn-glycerol-3-phosphate acyltransferase